MRKAVSAVLMILTICAGASPGDMPAKPNAKAALQTFNDLIGSWKGTGTPEGTPSEIRRGFWTETIAWEWQIKKDDVFLKASFEKGKHFTGGELRYLPDKDVYQFKVRTPEKETLSFKGPFKDQVLTLERQDKEKPETQRLILTLLHSNRFLYRYEIKSANRPVFVKRYEVGATKEGESFTGAAATIPECIVSGGKGRLTLEYKGATYYFCCSGCRDAFQENPDKYIKEAEAKKTKK